MDDSMLMEIFLKEYLKSEKTISMNNIYFCILMWF